MAMSCACICELLNAYTCVNAPVWGYGEDEVGGVEWDRADGVRWNGVWWKGVGWNGVILGWLGDREFGFGGLAR